ncbi:MAG TPA: ATPase, T2SS/T4P/T4SS family [Planctomycetota bacterium]|nr:ATPase, T2SS/T4P/T4SS family [Planctomycetota bacterium]
MAKFDKKLAGILTKCKILDEAKRDEMLAECEKNNSSLTQVLIEKKICDEETLITTVAEEMSYYPVNLSKIEASPEALEALTEEQANNYQVLPLARMGKMLTMAIANPFDVLILDDVKIVTGCEIIPVLTTETAIKKAIEKAYKKNVDVQGEMAATAALLDQQFGTDLSSASTQETEDENSGPIIKLGNRIIEDAYLQGASDIHIEPAEDRVYVRYRIDGILKDQLQLPKASHRALISRLKIMSDLNISERRLPQDGRIVYKKYNPKFDLDLRVSVAPMNHGEKICARILDKTKSCLPLEKLGFSNYNLVMYRDLIQVPYGMILHCGPTGSGKSMTLYAALNEINTPEVNISTAEDPIEYTLPRLNQMQMQKGIGLTFSAALRCYLRQDPDIILVGEIRDTETAEIAIEAALTGHVLFSTLHTNDAPSTITRFSEMEIEPFMISTCLVAICAQRLLRRLCGCKQEDTPKPEELALLKRAKDDAPAEKIWRPVGCPRCSGSGYKGRLGTHELLKNTDELRALINKHATSEELKTAARKGGMRTLFEDLMEKVKQGLTSLPEAVGTARPDDTII